LDRLMAVGGTAEVYAGHDELLDRPVAVKVLHRHLTEDAELMRRFRSEAIAAGRLHDPGIVRVYDTCSDDGTEAIVMELVDGRTLRQEIDAGPLSRRRTMEVVASVSRALTTAHRAGVVHRDVKPANILVAEDGRVLVTDFGVAKLADGDRTAEGLMLGSAKYLSPEQVRGDPVDGRADQFALAVVALECLVGRAPWTAETPMATALARLHEAPPRVVVERGDCSDAVDDVLGHALATDPAERFADLPAFVEALGAALTVEPSPGLQVEPPERDADATLVAPRGPVGTDPVPPPRGQVAPAPPPDTSTPVVAPVPPPPPARRRGPALLVGGLVLTAVAIVAALLVGTGPGRDLAEQATEAIRPVEPLTFTVSAFDPQGTGNPGENDEDAPLAADGDDDTAWRTEGYDRRDLAPKSGVGLVMTLEETAELSSLDVTTTTSDWAAEVYVSSSSGSDLASWGVPVTSGSSLEGQAGFDLDGTEGSAVLLWITDLGDGPPRVRAEVAELVLSGR
jgi:serine/threonine-protein kinase